MSRSQLFRLPPDLSPELRSNFINYFFDIGWWGLYAGATVAFLTIYAARVGANPQQIGLLSALPAGVTLLLSLPGGWAAGRMSAHTSTLLGAFFTRIFFITYALLPFFLPPAGQVNALLVIAVIMAVPATLVGISFNHLFMEAVPPEWRGMVVGGRNAIFSIISFIVTVISGQILTHLPFPVNYQVVFAIGFVGGIMTVYHIWRVRPLIKTAAPLPMDAPAIDNANGSANGAPAAVIPPGPRLLVRISLRGRQILPTVDAAGRRYIRVISMLFLFGMVNSMASPLVPEVLVHRLKLSDAWISVGTAANSLIVFLVSLFIAFLIRRTGNRRAVTLGAALMAAQAVILALANDAALYLLSALAGGLGSGILITAQFNYHIDNVPETDRAVWLSWNLLLGNAALLLGAVIGPLLAQWTNVPLALAGTGMLRLVIGIAILRWGYEGYKENPV